jgi:GTP cyclohydrolase IB
MSHPTEALHLPDTQSERDARHVAIQRVGIKGLRYPLALQVGGAVQQGAATWALDVALPAEQKGTHMSRFVAWLEEGAPLVFDSALLRRRQAAMREGRVEAAFSFFIRKRAPVSGLASMLDYEAKWIVDSRAGSTTLWAEVAVPVKSLCPCSKEISDYGAHNQRACVTLRLELLADIDWTELVRLAEDEASSELWPMLKRADEKWVTERAYENPKFVEDLVRDVALRVQRDARIGRYVVEVENFESIHNHSAYARVERSSRA